jgi:hypothetical protein
VQLKQAENKKVIGALAFLAERNALRRVVQK